MFDQWIRNHAKQKRWEGKDFKRFTGKTNRRHAELSEIRFKADDKQHRVIGFFGPGAQQYTLLIGCNHKGKIYQPPDALDSAATRRKEIQSGKAKHVERKI